MPVHSLKRPGERSYGSQPTGPGDDPRYIAVSKGSTRRDGIPIPKADPKWHPQARSWFNSLALSGQSDMYEASDWAMAVAAAGAYDIFLRTYNASVLTQFNIMSARLGCTVTDRKRSRIELSDPEPSDADEDAAEEIVNGWQDRLRLVR
jgi:hypothetical protein